MTVPPTIYTDALRKAAAAKSATGNLRDYFAGLAMQAYCSDAKFREDMDQGDVALCAYRMADAMLTERDKP